MCRRLLVRDFLHELVGSGLELQVVRSLVQFHRMFQARDSGQSSGSIPKENLVVG